MRIKIQSLGCRLNQAEIQSISTRLQESGHTIVTSGGADIYIINACAVTVISERKTRKLTYQAMRAAENDPEAMIFVTGCGTGEKRREGKIYFLSNDYKHMIPQIIDTPALFDDLAPGNADRFSFHAPVKSARTRVNIKIQDGCNNFCSYCIIPYLRGREVSRPAADILSECRTLLAAGYRELILTGVMVGSYRDGDRGFDSLVEDILRLEGNFRLHLSSLSPHTVTDRLIALMGHEKMVRHLSLSLQSGSNRILKAMKRRYTTEDYCRIVDAIRKIDEDYNLTTDLIVGFPGETDADFEDSLATIKKANFSHIHTFRYSPRPGTEAAKMKETVPEEIKKERSQRVINLYMKQKEAYHRRFHERESLFISERSREGVTGGYNEYYVPVKVREKLPRNHFYRIRTFCGDDPARLDAEVIEEIKNY